MRIVLLRAARDRAGLRGRGRRDRQRNHRPAGAEHGGHADPAHAGRHADARHHQVRRAGQIQFRQQRRFGPAPDSSDFRRRAIQQNGAARHAVHRRSDSRVCLHQQSRHRQRDAALHRAPAGRQGNDGQRRAALCGRSQRHLLRPGERFGPLLRSAGGQGTDQRYRESGGRDADPAAGFEDQRAQRLQD